MNLFAENNSNTNAGVTQLDHTARLTQQAMEAARHLLTMVDAKDDGDEKDYYTDLIKRSMSDHDVMDDLIEQTVDLMNSENVDYLKTCDEGLIDRMIKSQQSKRSRSKGKVMTKDNYMTMLTGAIAENLLRIAANKPKNAGSLVSSGTVEYSPEALSDLQQDQERLGRAIRNIQSKKSIAKKRRDWDENSDKWQALLTAEAQLKAIRTGSSAAVTTKAVKMTSEIKETLKDIDLSSLKSSDSKAILATIYDLVNGDATEDETKPAD